MSRLGSLLLVWALCEGVFAKEGKQNGFVEPLDFSAIFDSGDAGVSSLASKPLAAALLKVDKSQYPELFDTVVSSSIDSLQRRLAPKENVFSAERFGFNPIASQGFHGPGQAARLSAPPHPRQPHQQPLTHLPVREQVSPLRYDIRTVHDADYKVYKPIVNEQGEEILAALKQNPSVSSYFKPQATNLEVAHPIKYRKEESSENSDIDQNYRPNAYITGSSRIRRYAGGRRHESRSERLRSAEDEDDPYNYKAEYVSRPKAFDEGPYSAYKEEKDPNKDYEYPYNSEYDHKEYERIKELSEKQAAEIRQNPGNCKEVLRDGMSCMVCKDPKTKGNYESCSYVTEPKNNKYAYSKERKFDSNDEPDEPEHDEKSDQPKSAKYEAAKDDSQEYPTSAPEETHSDYKKEDDDSDDKYKAYYTHSSKPKTSESLRAESDEESEEKSDTLAKPYNYKAALPGFYSDNEPKKDVEHVLAEFKKKDRSSCKKVQKNGMTCFQCIDKAGLKNEECMFVSESAPQRSHLAYQEVKEFTSKPETIGSESQIITTSAPPERKAAAYVVSNNNYGKKLKRKKARPANLANAASSSASTAVPAQQQRKPHVVKRSAEAEAESRAEIVDETNIAAPEEFAGDNSKGAFWAETRPRYSASLGVTLPEFMLAPSEHEASFDEVVASA